MTWDWVPWLCPLHPFVRSGIFGVSWIWWIELYIQMLVNDWKFADKMHSVDIYKSSHLSAKYSIIKGSPRTYTVTISGPPQVLHTLRGNNATTPSLYYGTWQVIGLCQETSYSSSRRNNCRCRWEARSEVTMLRRTWSENGFPNATITTRTLPYSP